MPGRIRSAWLALTGGSKRSHRLGRFNSRRTASGIDVSPVQALRIATVYACVKRISEDIGGLPAKVFEKRDGTRKEVGESDPVAYLLTVQPNPNIDSGELWRTVVGWMLLTGNAYVFCEYDAAGKLIGLWPLASSSVEPKRAPAGGLMYKITLDRSSEWAPVDDGKTYPASQVLHYRAFGLGDVGLSPIAAAREQAGINFASTVYIGKFFANDATPGTVLSVAGELSDKQYARLDEQWRDKHEGFENSHKLSIVEGGAKLEQTTLSPADAQFLEVYKLSRVDIASGIFSVPPHKIGDLEHATFSNIEHQAIEYVQDALMLWVNRIERVNRKLFPANSGRYFKLNLNGLVRGDMKSRYDAYAVGRQWGFLSANDILRLEDAEPIAGGDEYLVPLNMLPASATAVQRATRSMKLVQVREIEAGPQLRAAESPALAAPAWVTRVDTLLGDFLAEQQEAILAELDADRATRSLTAEDQAKWDAELAGSLGISFAGIVAEFGAESARLLGEEFRPDLVVNWVSAAADRQAHNFNETTFQQLRARLAELTEGETSADAVNGVFAARVAGGALIAAGIVHAIGSFGTNEGARQAGATSKRWVTPSDNPRPTHAQLNGESIGIDERFSNGCMYPGDPSGGADEVAGCTCYLEIS